MSSFVIACPNPVCGKPLNLPAEAVGQSLSCPHCLAGISVAFGPDDKPKQPAMVKPSPVPGWVVLGTFLAVTLLPVFVCAGGLWWMFQPPGRSDIGEYDIGHGRRVHIWSKGDEWGDPICVYYRITQWGTELCPTTFIGVDHGEQFEFRTAFADNGNVACVYEVNLAADDCEFLIIHDAEHGETWPRDDKDPGKWRELYEKLGATNPDFPRVRHFEQ